MPLVFNISLQLVSIRLRCPKPMSVAFEFTNAKTVVVSKNFHKVEANVYETVLREAVDMPLVVAYDPRKGRFISQAIEFNVLSNHGGFSKKIAAGAINVAQVLNTHTLISREQVKLDKCFDKNALLSVKVVLDFKGTHSGNDYESMHASKFNMSGIR